MLLLAASLFITTPAPLDLPRASAYLVSGTGVPRLEDRYDIGDLWTSQTVEGRWMDDDGRIFLLATADAKVPTGLGRLPRMSYERTKKPIKVRDLGAVRAALAPLAPFTLPELPSRPHVYPRGYDDIDYWHGTNTSAIVCAYLPENTDVWRLAIWELVEGDDFAERLKTFEDDFLGIEAKNLAFTGLGRAKSERELLRRDARHSVANYDGWHVTDGDTFVVLDDLATRNLTVAFTNDLVRLQKRFVETIPGYLDGTNTLSVARIYATREEYLDALALSGLTNMSWSAAYWCPQRRELVAHADAWSGDYPALLKTLRHEAFHQYLSYATAMLETSPWLNEGYAQYFEEEESRDWKLTPGFRCPTAEELESYAALLPSLFATDYESFYSGTDDERRLKYRLAWSIAVFLEEGAPKLRFRPFAKLKSDYIKALIDNRDPRVATVLAFKTREKVEQFVGAWLAYWKSLP